MIVTSRIKLTSRTKRAVGILLFTSLVLAATNCTLSPRISSRGNSLDPNRVEQIKVGVSNREQVIQILGSPSSRALFGKESWYYVAERQEVLAFFAPEVKDRNVIIIQFDNTGTVEAIDKFGLEKAANIIPVNRKTPTVGKEMTVIDQIVGNFNRFRNKSAEKAKK